MTCILFSRVSFLALCGDTSFQDLCEIASVPLYGLGHRLFEMNRLAYRAQHCLDPEIDSKIEQASVCSLVDIWVMDYLRGPRDREHLLCLIDLIDYGFNDESIYKSSEYQDTFARLIDAVEATTNVAAMTHDGASAR